MSRQNKDMPKPSGAAIAAIKKIVETFALADFTDGGGTSGTAQFAGSIPKGAVFLGATAEVAAAFAGDSSATLTIGDGSDADRYNTGTPSVFTTGVKDMGVPSGQRHHSAAVQPTLTVTSGSDFGSVSGGQVVVELYYI